MRISWKRVGIIAGVVVVLVAGERTSGTQPYKQSIVKCNPNACTPAQICGQTTETPKTCGESRNGPYFGSTFSCCCCTESSKGRWFFGE